LQDKGGKYKAVYCFFLDYYQMSDAKCRGIDNLSQSLDIGSPDSVLLLLGAVKTNYINLIIAIHEIFLFKCFEETLKV